MLYLALGLKDIYIYTHTYIYNLAPDLKELIIKWRSEEVILTSIIFRSEHETKTSMRRLCFSRYDLS